jgi:hypothetical protein
MESKEHKRLGREIKRKVPGPPMIKENWRRRLLERTLEERLPMIGRNPLASSPLEGSRGDEDVFFPLQVLSDSIADTYTLVDSFLNIFLVETT